MRLLSRYSELAPISKGRTVPEVPLCCLCEPTSRVSFPTCRPSIAAYVACHTGEAPVPSSSSSSLAGFSSFLFSLLLLLLNPFGSPLALDYIAHRIAKPDRISGAAVVMLKQAFLRPALRGQVRSQCAQAARRSLFTHKQAPFISHEYDLNKLNAKRRDYEYNRTAFLAAGAVAGIISFIYTAFKLKDAINLRQAKEKVAAKCDAPSIPNQTFKTEAGERRKVVLHDNEGNEIIPTGNTTVQVFPRRMDVKLPTEKNQNNSIQAAISDKEGTEFTLVGAGTRSVTIFGIEVYVVGFYVATQDIAQLQHYLVKKVNPMATTLIPSEKDSLRKALKEATEGEEIWSSILEHAACRTLFRVVPVKDTDFHHLRDGFVRAITARSQRSVGYSDEAFGAAMKDFKAIFNRGSVPKKTEMLLCRDEKGTLSIMYSGGDTRAGRKDVMGTVSDERLSRLLWLNYLAGDKVASEKARQSIIDGVMEFVERPVGTVATQVL